MKHPSLSPTGRSPTRAVVVALGLLAASATLFATDAHACSPPMPAVHRTLEPATAATAVPLNAQIRARYRQYSGDYASTMPPPHLADAAGNEVAATVTKVVNKQELVFLIEPTAPLSANTTYSVVDHLGVTGTMCSLLPGAADACNAKEVTAGTFTTGTAADDIKPGFLGLSGIKSTWQECDNSACCGPYKGWHVALAWDKATDNLPAEQVRYNVYGPAVAGGAIKRLAHSVTFATGASGGGFLIGTTSLGAMPDGDYEVCAIDQAGNETCTGKKMSWQAPPPPGSTDGGGTDADAGGSDADGGSGDVDGGDTDDAPDADDAAATDDTVDAHDSDSAGGDGDAAKDAQTGTDADSAGAADVQPDTAADVNASDTGADTTAPDTASGGTAASTKASADSGCSAIGPISGGPGGVVLLLMFVVAALTLRRFRNLQPEKQGFQGNEQ